MNETIKIRIHHPDGRREKIALRISSGTHIALNEEALGMKTGCVLELTPSEHRIETKPELPKFSINGKKTRSAAIKVGDIVEVAKIKIEFLVLPVIEEAATRMVTLDAATRMVNLGTLKNEEFAPSAEPVRTSDAVTQEIAKPAEASHEGPVTSQPEAAQPEAAPAAAAMAAPAEKQTDESLKLLDDRALELPAAAPSQTPVETAAATPSAPESAIDSATQMILKMAVPQKPADQIQFPQMSRLEVRGKAEEPERPDWRQEKKWWIIGGASAAVASLAILITILVWPRGSKIADQVVVENQAETPTETAPGTATDRQPAGEISQDVAAQPVAPSQPQAAQAPLAPVAVAQPPQPAQAAQPAQVTQAQAPAPQGLQDPEEANDNFSMPKEEFFSALRANDMGLIKRLVESRVVDVNLTLDRGNSALHIAASRGYFDLVKYLVKKRANVNARDLHGATPLMWATYKQQKDIALYLVKHGADLKAQREDGIRAIDVAKRYKLKSYYAFLTPAEPKRMPASTIGKKSKSTSKAAQKRAPASSSSSKKPAGKSSGKQKTQR